MKASEIALDGTTRIKIDTRTDARRIIITPKHLADYIQQYGDVEVIETKPNIYKVPKFAEIIAEYTQLKAVDCARYGSH